MLEDDSRPIKNKINFQIGQLNSKRLISHFYKKPMKNLWKFHRQGNAAQITAEAYSFSLIASFSSKLKWC